MPEFIERIVSDAVEQKEIIEVKQLPIIIEQLAIVKQSVEAKTNTAIQMVCTEDNYREIKALRTSLNKELKEWEAKRKDVKSKVMTPYERFEAVYKDCISNPYKKADAELKKKIDSVENGLKSVKEEKAVKYFNEYAESLGIDFVTFSQVGCNITMSISDKKLKEQVKSFLDKIMDDLKLIAVQEHKAEILVEYKRTLNVSQAITSVTERFKAIEAERQRELAEQTEREKAAENEANNESAFEPFMANVPQEIDPPTDEKVSCVDTPSVAEQETQKIYPLSFTIYGTKEQLKEVAQHIKDYLSERGMRYE